MKKLMIAAAIVCAAAMSQAATCYWNFMSDPVGGTLYKADGTGTFSGTGYVYLLGVGLDQDTVLSAVRGGSNPSGYLTTVDFTDGRFEVKGYQADGTPGADTDFFYVVKDGDKLYLSDIVTAMATESTMGSNVTIAPEWLYTDGEPIETGTFAEKVERTGGADGWGEAWYDTASVPEPTSGLLLLLGVAGLALKRKRA